MIEIWQKLVFQKIIILFLRKPVQLHEIKQNEKHPFMYKSILQSILLRQQKSCIKIFSGFSYEMKILCLEPLQKAVLS